MKKGKIVIDYESKEPGECKFNINQTEGKLDDDNLKSLFENILRELMADEFEF